MALACVPSSLRPLLVKHRELVKFVFTGGICFVLTLVVNYGLKLTVMKTKPVTALSVAIVVATIASYLLNREWSFRTRGGRVRHLEVVLYFLVSAVGLVVNDIPLYLARYAFHLRYPEISRLAQEVSDFVSGMIIGTLLATGFRWWAMKKWVFPHAGGRSAPVRGMPDTDREDTRLVA